MPVSIRTRLTVGTAVTAAVVLGLLAVMTTVQLQDTASAAATQLAADDIGPYVVDLGNQPDEAPDLAADGRLVLVVGPDGTVRRDSMPPALAAAVRSVGGSSDVVVADGEFRVVARSVPTPDGIWRLWAARDLTASVSLLRGVLTTVLIGTPLAVLVMALTAWLVASAALRPVERMRSTAERLRARGAGGSLPRPRARELADLAATLNGLIADLRASAAHERRVTADAAHELRTPLAVLAAEIELAERDPTHADLAGIRASVDRMSTLADGLLTLSRLDSTEGEQRVDTPVAELVTEAMDAVDRGRLLARPEVLIDLELADGLDEHALAAIDVTGFGRVLTNLIGNALAAGPASGVVVRLMTKGRELVLEVVDDGPGLPADFLPFAFDRFARPEGARSTGSAGSGLGLALVKGLAERGGGSVGLRNREMGGAVATVRMPLRETPAA